VVKFGFYPSKLKKQPFFANNFKLQGGPWPPCPPFRRPWLRHVHIIFLVCVKIKASQTSLHMSHYPSNPSFRDISTMLV